MGGLFEKHVKLKSDIIILTMNRYQFEGDMLHTNYNVGTVKIANYGKILSKTPKSNRTTFENYMWDNIIREVVALEGGLLIKWVKNTFSIYTSSPVVLWSMVAKLRGWIMKAGDLLDYKFTPNDFIMIQLTAPSKNNYEAYLPHSGDTKHLMKPDDVIIRRRTGKRVKTRKINYNLEFSYEYGDCAIRSCK